MASEVVVPELSWLLTLVCLTVLIVLVAMCVCSKSKELPTHEYGTAGRLSMTRDSPIFQHQASNGNVITLRSVERDLSDEEDEVSTKRNSWMLKDRALPDIPETKTELAPAAEANTVAAAVSQEETNHKRKTHKKSVAPKPPVPDTSSSKEVQEKTGGNDFPHVMKIAVNDKTTAGTSSVASSSGFGSRPWSQVVEDVPGTSDGSVILKKIGNNITAETVSGSPARRLSDSDAYESVTNPYMEPHGETISLSSSPVCIRIGSATQTSTETPSSVTPAGLAVAGAVPSSDIPYMTPPLLHNPPSTNEDSPERGADSTGSRSEVPYTVISVREPLARVREMTMRRQRNASQSPAEGENQYAMVPEEEQMYAEIGSGHDSGSSSITYAHIEPRELPPVPPTVESLKSVAHAHSRQASTVSNSSVGSAVSGSAESSSPPQLRHLSSLYSTVEKDNKHRKTIHIAEGASAISTAEKHKKVEDLYAKVRKKRVELTVSASSSEEYSGYQGISGEDSECLTPPPSPWASTTPPAPPPIAGRLQASSLGMLFPSKTQQHVRRHSADPNLPEKISETTIGDNKRSVCVGSNDGSEPGYEQIYNEDDNGDDSCYEKIKDENVPDGKSALSFIKHTASVGHVLPRYKGTKSLLHKEPVDPGYECVAQMENEGNSSDPGYEPVRVALNLEDSDSNHGYTTVKVGEESDPNYETVKKLYRSESDAVDPGYEKIKKLFRNDSDATDPGYERVRTKQEAGEPGYETVNRSDSDNEPGYETVRDQQSNREISSIVQSTPSSSISVVGNSTVLCNPSNSTVLFVSGNTVNTAKVDENVSKCLNESLDETEAGNTVL